MTHDPFDTTQQTRLKRELTALQNRDYHVVWNTTLQGAEIRNWRYPDGWRLRNRRKWRQRDGVPRGPDTVAPLLIRFLQTYPQTRPYAYLPRDLTYTQGTVNHLIDPQEVDRIDDFPSDDWLLWCVEYTGWQPNDPDHTLATFLQTMQGSFSYPDKDRPLRHVYANL